MTDKLGTKITIVCTTAKNTHDNTGNTYVESDDFAAVKSIQGALDATNRYVDALQRVAQSYERLSRLKKLRVSLIGKIAKLKQKHERRRALTRSNKFSHGKRE